MWSGSWKVGR
uniref:Uncharacterized protein n=1 Tax=Arundo donax TaxID=35708 RepID=A0A0A9A7P0_ARUDO